MPEAYAYADVKSVPIGLLPEAVVIPIVMPGTVDWTDSSIYLREGQVFVIEASGAINPCFGSSGYPEVCSKVWGPEGIGFLSSTIANEPLLGGTLAALVGQIGDGPTFEIGRGGEFVANADGTLRFTINERPTSNNAGEFIIFVRVEE